MVDKQEQLEPGWEFTVPGWVVKPYYWILAILIIIALILSIQLFNKIQAARSGQTGAQSVPQVTNTQ